MILGPVFCSLNPRPIEQCERHVCDSAGIREAGDKRVFFYVEPVAKQRFTSSERLRGGRLWQTGDRNLAAPSHDVHLSRPLAPRREGGRAEARNTKGNATRDGALIQVQR